MASPNSTFTEIVSTTLREHKKTFADNVSNHNALHRRLTSRGKVTIEDGGYEIVTPLDYAENSTFQRYSGYDVLNVSPSDVLSAAKYDWKQAAVHVSASGLELRQNAGKNQLIKLAKSRMTNAMRTFRNNLSSDFYSDGTTANQVNGLTALIADAGTGTVGGINSTTYSFWQNNTLDATDFLSGSPTSSNFKQAMNDMWLSCTRGGDTPDLVIMDKNFFVYYWEGLQDLQRYGDVNEAKAGFTTLKYVTADVYYDSTDSGITADHAYFINTDFLGLSVHRDANMTEVADKRSTNQDAVVMPIIWQGNLTCSNRSLQGVIKD